MAAKKKSAGQLPPERVEEIRRSVEEGRGRSMFDNPTPDMDRFHGAMCRCGVPRKPLGLAKHMSDDGKCTVHPDAAVQPWVRGVTGGAR